MYDSIADLLKRFNITEQEFIERSTFMAEPSYIIDENEAVVFDGDNGIMVIGFDGYIFSFELVDCKYFEDFTDLIPEVMAELTNLYIEEDE